jgi:citrate lyase subunit beta / citryl-CoA lyase
MVSLHRSWLFLPGNNARFLSKAVQSAADAVILDIEDAVIPDQKLATRDALTQVLKTVDFHGKVRTVRVNGIDTPWGKEDIEMMVRSRADLLMIPKADAEDVVVYVDRLVSAVEREEAIEQGTTKLILLIETPKGLINVERTAQASMRIVALCFGSGDYTYFTQGLSTPGEWEYAYPRARILNAARAAGQTPVGAAYRLITDPDGLRQSALRDKQLGYEGKTAIHPTQIQIINDVFTPTRDEINRARRVVDAYDAAERRGLGATTLEGTLVEYQHAAEARRVLDLAKKAGVV